MKDYRYDGSNYVMRRTKDEGGGWWGVAKKKNEFYRILGCVNAGSFYDCRGKQGGFLIMEICSSGNI